MLHLRSYYTETGATLKSNITLKIDSELLREARVLAAIEGSSISALLAARLEQAVRERKGYNQARRSALARLRTGSTGVKHRRARTLIEQLWNSGKGELSTQVLQEL